MGLAIALFVGSTVLILAAGPAMASTADHLAKATGLGGALFGAVFLALATDLPEVALTPAAVVSQRPGIAVGGLLGSAAAQLTLLAVADIAYRKGTVYEGRGRGALSHCALLAGVLTVPVYFAGGGPMIGWISAGSIVMTIAYVGSLALTRAVSETPAAPDEDEPVAEERSERSLAALWARFGIIGLVLAGAGVGLEAATARIGGRLGLSETAAGALLAGGVTSLPELVTVVAAVRRGAIDLALGDLAGSSALDVALLVLADAVYTDGSVFALIGPVELRLVGLSMALTALLTVALVRRSRAWLGGAAVESYLMVGVFAGTVVLLIT